MFIEVKPPQDGLKFSGRRSRRGRIVETLFVVLALMCLPVLLFGQWFVGAYGNPAKIAANAAESTANRNHGDDSSGGSDTKNEGTQDDEQEGSHEEDTQDEDEDEDHDADAGGNKMHREHAAAPVEDVAADATSNDGTDSSPGLGGDDLIAETDAGDEAMKATAPAVTDEPVADAMGSRTDVNPFSDEPDSDTAALLDSSSDLDAPPIETLPVTPPMEEEPLAQPVAGNDSDPDLNSAPMDLARPEAGDLAVDTTSDLEPVDDPVTAPADPVVSSDGNPSATELNLDTMLDDPPKEEAPVPQPRTWTRRDGKGGSVTAIFIRAERIDDEIFVFLAAPGNPKEYKLRLELLSDADIEYVKDTVRRAQASE